MTKINLTILIIFSSQLLGGYNYSTGNSFKTAFPSKDFLNMEGIAVTHELIVSSDSLSDNKIIELQDNNGLTIWYGRYFYKDICITGICRMVKLWIFWDGVGNYLGIQLDETDPLTKSDHTPFEPDDYIRLDEILGDTVSILKELEYEELVIEEKVELDLNDSNKKNLFELIEVDGYSSATLPSLKEYVIKDAVFTCYTLWHTVYGETKLYIDDILSKRIDAEYINKLLKGSENQQLFALEMIRRNDSFFSEFNSQIFLLVTSSNKIISEKALSVITPQFLDNSESQLRFIELMDNSLPETKYEIIYKLQLIDNISTKSIILLIDKYMTGKISAGGLNQIFKVVSKQMLINQDILNNKEIESRLVQLSNHTDPYTANITKNFLKSNR